MGAIIGNIFRGYVEGIGSKALAFILAGIVSAIVSPILFAKFGVSPEVTFDVLCGIGTVVVLGVLKIWHVDIKTEGKSTTAALMTLKSLQTAEQLLPDGTVPDRIVRQVIEALQKAQGKEPPAAVAVAPVPPQAPSPGA